MEDKSTPKPDASAPTAESAPKPSVPVMDVVPPKAAEQSNAPAQASAGPVEEPPAEEAEEASSKATPKQAPAKATTPKAKSTAPIAAIVLAVLAFCVLAGLALYAYSKG